MLFYVLEFIPRMIQISLRGWEPILANNASSNLRKLHMHVQAFVCGPTRNVQKSVPISRKDNVRFLQLGCSLTYKTRLFNVGSLFHLCLTAL